MKIPDCKKSFSEMKDFTSFLCALTDEKNPRDRVFEICYSYWLFRCCHFCARKGTSLKCAGCKTVYYCNTNCQTQDWAKHQEVCLSARQGYELLYGKPPKILSLSDDDQDQRVVGFRSFRKYCLHKLAAEYKSTKLPYREILRRIGTWFLILHGAE